MSNEKKRGHGLGKCILIIIVLGIIASCTSPTKTDEFSLSGKVLSKAQAPIANARVMVYSFVEISATNSEIKAAYPNHGASLDTYNRFDHRKFEPIMSTFTDEAGTFSFSGLVKGRYNVVATKEDIGFSYTLDLDIEDNITGITIDIQAMIELPNVIAGDFILESGRTYFSEIDLLVLPEGNMIVGTDVTLLMAPNTKIEVHGGLITDQASSLHISSLGGLYDPGIIADIGKLDSITIYSQESGILRNIYLDYCILGFRVVGCQSFEIENLFVNAEYQGFVASGCNSLSIKRSTITGSIESIRAAAYIINSESVLVERCHFWGNKKGLQISITQNSKVINNYFNDNANDDFSFAQDGEGIVEYNTFRTSNIAIFNYRGQMEANYNDIQARIGIYSERVDAWFSARFNNLNCSEYGIKSRCMYWNSPILHMDGTRNYWYTTNIDEIQELIYDRNDDSLDDENYRLLVTYVDYLPISNSPNNAGVFN